MKTINRYTIIEELERGGMATVYLAHDPRFDRNVAIKVLPPEFLHDKTFLERFQREARTIASLEHQAIVPVHDFGEQDGQPYLVMRFMPGGSLVNRMAHGPLPLPEITRIISQLAQALDYAHEHDVVHRDLKPSNILFDDQNNAYLSDFGIAKLVQTSANLTGSGVIGTPAYMSPEQVDGQGQLDGRSDIYTLGIILFQMLTGQLPYQADTPARQMMAHVLKPVPELHTIRQDLPEAYANIIKRTLAKKPEERFATAATLAHQLHSASSSYNSAPALPTIADHQSPPSTQSTFSESYKTVWSDEAEDEEPSRENDEADSVEVPEHPTTPPAEGAAGVLVNTDVGSEDNPAGSSKINSLPEAKAGAAPASSTTTKRRLPVWAWVVLGIIIVAAGGGFILSGNGGSDDVPIIEATDQAPEVVLEATNTAEPTATVTAQPSSTPTATATATAPGAPTNTPPSTGTSTPEPTATATVPPTTVVQIVAPSLVAPEHGTYQNPFTFEWGGTQGISYQVTLRNVDRGETHTSDWINGFSWTFDIPAEQFGNWEWFVATNSGLQSEVGSFVFDPHPNKGGSASNLPGDVNGDCIVDDSDYNALQAAFGTTKGEPNYNANADFDGDGDVDIFDYNALIQNYGLSCSS